MVGGTQLLLGAHLTGANMRFCRESRKCRDYAFIEVKSSNVSTQILGFDSNVPLKISGFESNVPPQILGFKPNNESKDIGLNRQVFSCKYSK